MAVRSIKNQYAGINAHLHSLWQSQGGWVEFHTRHIVHLADALKAVLLPMGYTAALEPSLQIRRIDTAQPAEYPESDVTIYDMNPIRPRPSAQGSPAAASGELVFSITETLFENPISEKTYTAIGIYEVVQGRQDRGEAVAWIELLSPSNKPAGRDVWDYFNKRIKIIESGLVYIELDYLHESAPTLRGLPDYHTKRDHLSAAEAHPYRILIVDPRPNLEDGVVRVKEFDVDEPIPRMNIVLNGEDVLDFDFGTPYHKTLSDALYGLEFIDYSQFPMNFDRYQTADKTRITNRMLAVLKAAEAGENLETVSIPTSDLALDAALAALVPYIHH
ncbi:MAG: DUF4058 family protein [Chloroflexi bacterium]|nr:DUF4058 family protein [Chloroflexota bacterium]MCC6896833.1 DUF4058 family protein [Anaerolineae bacterium]